LTSKVEVTMILSQIQNLRTSEITVE